MTQITTDSSSEGRGQGRFPHPLLTREIIGAFFDVYNELGYGFLERVYRSALRIVLAERDLDVRCETSLNIQFHGHRIGAYRADMIINERVIIELKAGAIRPPGSKAQLINYLRLSGLEVGLLLFFGPTAEFNRVIASRSGSDVR